MKTTHNKITSTFTVEREFNGRKVSAHGCTMGQATQRLIDRIALIAKTEGQDRTRMLRCSRRTGSMVDTHV